MRWIDGRSAGFLAALIMASSGCDGGGLRPFRDGGASPNAPAASDTAAAFDAEQTLDPGGAAGFVARMAATICTAVSPCCPSLGFAHDAAACTTTLVSHLAPRFPSGAGRIRYDAAAELVCLDALMETVGRCTGPSVQWGVAAEPAASACARVFVGTVAVGGACSSWEDCDATTGPVACMSISPGSAMRCVSEPAPDPIPPRPVLRIGQPCTVYSSLEVCFSDCEPVSFCDGDGGGTGNCMAKRASGSCADQCGAACTGDSYCAHPGRTCLPRIPAGSACSDYSSCAGPNISCQRGVCAADLLDLCTS